MFFCFFFSFHSVEDWIPQPEKKVWHPVVWQQPPPPIPPEQCGFGEVVPHTNTHIIIFRHSYYSLCSDNLKVSFLTNCSINSPSRMHPTNALSVISIDFSKKPRINQKFARNMSKTCYWPYQRHRKHLKQSF